MKEKGLQDIAQILRRDCIISTSEAGSGHLTSCLSCADIMSVLFFQIMRYDVKNPYNPDNDEFILSKGHAAPVLYSSLYRAGCINTNLYSLRKLNSILEGHPMPRSLNWVKIATGSLGQGLSVGLGFALAAKLKNRKYKTYVLLGDSELAEGSIYEALELASYYKCSNLIAIVDVNRLGQRGETMFGRRIENYKKMFEGFNWKVLIIDGHNIGQIVLALKKAAKSNKPVIILAKTIKGKGISFVEDKEGWHGKTLSGENLRRALTEIPNNRKLVFNITKPKKIIVKKEILRKLDLLKYKLGDRVAVRAAYGDALASLAKSDSKVIAVDAEVSNSTRSEKVKKINEKQFLEVFIAEQNLIGVSLGLSKKGFNVFANTFAAFFSRAHDQIRMGAISSADLTCVGSHAGVSIGADGASQMGLEDIAIFRDLQDSKVFYPSDAVSAQKLTILASKLKGIKYIRTTRDKTDVIYKNNEKFDLGDFKVLKSSGKDKAVIVGSGITLHEALKSYKILKDKKISVAVVDLYCVKPFNAKKFISFVKKHGKFVIISEDHYLAGGIGEMLAEELENSGIKIKHLYVDEIPHSGTKEELLEKYKIDANAIESAVEKIVR